jgi:(p)ppGpp synthase/HD superfamily hydrolase
MGGNPDPHAAHERDCRKRPGRALEIQRRRADESRFDKWFNQIREVLSTQDVDSVDFLQDFKRSFLAEEIYVYTPKAM